ncbi:ROK family protein [Telmatocola sphagniphila]|uniref:ROK family protein n=1 Tax=Telmatocola sphagniphila TaxID=1123043 RepID=A0A8E6B9V6_9BACT|nr:ROK family protein [Telmatocola sphagniphila]QVL33050.1 ROK family protein [Telmatocola sphagniphila]
MANSYWIGIDLGGTKILSGLFDSKLKLISKIKKHTDADQGGEAVLQRITESVQELITENKVDTAEIRGMGFAVPGQIQPNSSFVRYAPNLNWRDYDLKPLMPKAWKWPVIVDNDVRMGTYGEWTLGAAKGAKNVFGIFAGTGVGGGLILNGELYHGFNGHAGEIGHIVIHWRRGSELEDIAGRKNMMKRAKELLDDAPKKVRKPWKDIVLPTLKSSSLSEFYEADDPIAVQIVEDASRAIGCSIASVINFLSPEIIVIGGGVTHALGESFTERIWEFAQKYSLPKATNDVKFVTAALGDDSGIVGAAAYAKTRFEGK